MTGPVPVASFRILPGGFASMEIDDSRVTNMLTASELIDLAARATNTAAQLSAPTPARQVGHLKRTHP